MWTKKSTTRCKKKGLPRKEKNSSLPQSPSHVENQKKTEVCLKDLERKKKKTYRTIILNLIGFSFMNERSKEFLMLGFSKNVTNGHLIESN